MTLDELEATIAKLPLHERAELARRVIAGLDDPTEVEIEALWIEEAERRLDEMEQGQVAEVPAEDVLRRARSGRPGLEGQRE